MFLVSLFIFAMLAAIPGIIGFALYFQASPDHQKTFCCPVAIVIMLIIFVMSVFVMHSNYKSVTHVGFGSEGIMIRHRATDPVIVEWKDIKAMDLTDSPTEIEYVIRYINPSSGLEAADIIDFRIAELIKARMAPAKVPEDRRFCPGCGRKNDGWAYCPDCGTGWDR